MLYKPNFCCHCGEKVERAEWSVLTSRRFCALCETENKPTDYAVRAFVAVGLILGLFGVAAQFRGPADAGQPTARPAEAVYAKSRLQGSAGGTTSTQPDPSHSNKAPAVVSQPAAAGENSVQRPVAEKPSTEPVLYCGAMTKKGTPCTRRVKSKVRCWQHQGMPAIK